MWNQIRAALAFVVMVALLGIPYLFLAIWLRSKSELWGNVVSVVFGIVILGFMEHGWAFWSKLWRVKNE